jgi:hypothetical protein
VPEQNKQPGFVMAILALLGVFSLPQVLKLHDDGSTPAEAEKVVSSARSGGLVEDDNEETVRNLGPLIEYLSNGKHRPTKNETLESFFCQALCGTTVRSLVITLPNPIESVASARFDEYLDVVQRAVELQGYVLDRSILPWKETTESSNEPPDRTTGLQVLGVDVPIKVVTTTPSKPKEDRPGLMVFRRAFPRTHLDPKEPKEPSLLLAFLVPESPITGIRKQAFVQSLDLIDRFFRPEPSKGKEWSVVHIIAPTFSSSARSLELALRSWKPPGPEKYHFRVISSSAIHVEKERLEGIFGDDDRRKLTFHSMIHDVTDLMSAMIAYLEKSQHFPAERIAILIESNSGLAQALAQKRRNPSPLEFLYPLQVSEVRKAYAKAGVPGNGATGDPTAPEKLKIPPDEGGAPRDLPRSFTPSTAAALDEMALTQVLTTIARHSYDAVGIIATDPFDVVFLAREVRRFCPNVRLFTTSADLLAARPAGALELRGMLVASTYPLYPSNQWMTTPFYNGARVFFSDRGSQGLYNATVAHLWEMGADEPANPDQPTTPELLEFGLPYDSEQKKLRTPPVWISAVGERGLFPITFSTLEEISHAQTDENTPLTKQGPAPKKAPDTVVAAQAITDDCLYDPSKSPEARPVSFWPENTDAVGNAQAAMRTKPHLLFSLLVITLNFGCALIAIVTLAYVLWSTDPKKLRFGPVLKLFGLAHVLKLLNCEVAEKYDVEQAIDPDSKGPIEWYDPQKRFDKMPTRKYLMDHLILMSSIADPTRGDEEERDSILVAFEETRIKLRIFDSMGTMVVNKDEKKRSRKGWRARGRLRARGIKELDRKLASLKVARQLTRAEQASLKHELKAILAHDHYDECTIRLTSSFDDLKNIKKEERRNLILVAVEHGALRARILGSNGKTVIDFEEKNLPSKSAEIEGLKNQLASLRNRDHLTPQEERSIRRELKAIVGCDQFERCTLRLISSMSDVENINAGERKNQIVLAKENEVLRMRIFGEAGEAIVDFDEKNLGLRAPEINRFKVKLNDLWPRVLTPDEIDEFATAFSAAIGRRQFLPKVGAGTYLFAMNLVILMVCVYVFIPYLIGMNHSSVLGAPIRELTRGKLVPWLAYWLTVVAGALVACSTLLSFGELMWSAIVGRSRNWRAPREQETSNVALAPGQVERRSRASTWLAEHRESPRHVLVALRPMLLTLALLGTATCATWLFLSQIERLATWKGLPQGRVTFERVSNLPNGVSPIFPVLFLAVGLAALFHSRLIRRRVYRSSYLVSEPAAVEPKGPNESQFEHILREMRKMRVEVDRMIATRHPDLPNENPLILCAIFLLYVHIFFRWCFRDLPSSLEGPWFDWGFWLVFLAVFTAIIVSTLKLRALWRTTRKMLRFAVDLPLAPAFDRIPTRFKGWFFGEEEFELRKQIIIQQSVALGKRTTDELAGIFSTLFCESQETWKARFARLEEQLTSKDGTLDSTRAVYPFLSRFWGALPVEDAPRQSGTEGNGKDKSPDWLKYWPLMPALGQKLKTPERAVIRDWVTMAEDLIALQIVRWFAPALSQLLPMMQFLVIGSISLLLAVTSYPFGHQGWLMTLMVGLILVVAIVVANVLIGVNRDELISRVSNTTPGRLNFDSNFVGSILTTFAPLVGAVLAVSFDLSDLLHTWFGPLFQLF